MAMDFGLVTREPALLRPAGAQGDTGVAVGSGADLEAQFEVVHFAAGPGHDVYGGAGIDGRTRHNSAIADGPNERIVVPAGQIASVEEGDEAFGVGSRFGEIGGYEFVFGESIGPCRRRRYCCQVLRGTRAADQQDGDNCCAAGKEQGGAGNQRNFRF